MVHVLFSDWGKHPTSSMLHLVLGRLHGPCVVLYFFTERPDSTYVESLQSKLGPDKVVDLTDISDQKATNKILFSYGIPDGIFFLDGHTGSKGTLMGLIEFLIKDFQLSTVTAVY